jgi:hypothetical protein
LLAGLVSLIWSLLEAIYVIVEFLTALSWIADIVAWIKSKGSRAARKEARAEGAPPPPRSGSHIALIVFTLSSIVLTTLLVLKWLGKI